MTKRTRSILFVLSAVFIVVAVGIVAVNLFADGVVRRAIEKAGTEALNVAVNLEKVKFSLLGGSLNLEGLTIDNPSGCRHKTLLELKRGDMRVKTMSLLSDDITIDDLLLDGLAVTVEQNGAGSNLQEVIDSLHKAQPLGKRFCIGDLRITDITVNVVLPLADGPPQIVALSLSPIRMTDLGRDERLDLAALTHKILMAVAAGAAEQGSNLLPKAAAAVLTGVLDKAFNFGKTILDSPRPVGTADPNRGQGPGTRGQGPDPRSPIPDP